MPTTILRPYALSFKNRLTHKGHSEHNIKRDLALLFMAFATMTCIFLGFIMVLTSLENNPFFTAIVPTKIIELMFYVFFFLLLLSNTVAAIGNIFTAENMDLLLTTPTSSLRLYTAKVLEMLAETSSMFVVFMIPAALGFAYALDVTPAFFLTGIIVTIPFLLIPAGIAVFLGTCFVRFASLVWRRGTFLFFVLGCAALWVFKEIAQLLTQVEFEQDGTNAIVQLISLFDNPSPLWLPSRWASDLLSAHLGSSTELATTKIILLYITAAGSLALGFLVFDLMSFHIRSISIANARSTRRLTGASDVVRYILERLCALIPFDAQYRAIILKDLTSLVRDRAQSLQLLMFIGISVAYIILFKYMTIAMKLAPVAHQVWQAFLASMNILFAGFILTAVMTRLVYPSVSLEGKAFWILLISPLELRRLIIAKFWCWFPISSCLVLSLLCSGVLAIHLGAINIICMIIIGLSLSAGCTGLAIGLGSIFARFEWESPNQLSSGLGTLALLLSSLITVLLMCIPATALTFLVTVPNLRSKIGENLSIGLMLLSAFLVVFMGVFVSKKAFEKGALALAKRQA